MPLHEICLAIQCVVACVRGNSRFVSREGWMCHIYIRLILINDELTRDCRKRIFFRTWVDTYCSAHNMFRARFIANVRIMLICKCEIRLVWHQASEKWPLSGLIISRSVTLQRYRTFQPSRHYHVTKRWKTEVLNQSTTSSWLNLSSYTCRWCLCWGFHTHIKIPAELGRIRARLECLGLHPFQAKQMSSYLDAR